MCEAECRVSGVNENNMKRQVLVLVHCQEGYRNHKRIPSDFVEKLVQRIENSNFDEIIHLSASAISYSEDPNDTSIFHEIRGFINRDIEWNFSGFRLQGDVQITAADVDAIFDGCYSYQKARRERMKQSYWNIPLSDRRRILSIHPNASAGILEDDRFPRQFAWIPEIFRNPTEWQDTRITLGGLFGEQCVEDVRQILAWMGIDYEVDYQFVGFAID